MSGKCLTLLRHIGQRQTFRATTLSSPLSTLSSLSSNHAPIATSSPRMALLQKRWKGGKMGHQVESLKEMAHRPEREAAQERRKKKKDRKAAKKGKVVEEKAAAVNGEGDDDDDDDIYFGEEEEEEDEEDETLDGEPALPDPAVVQKKMDASVDRFRDSLKSIRGAEPTADMFDEVVVQAYGAPTPLNAVAQVVIVSPTLAQLTCFDPSIAKDVVKAVQLTLELNPQLEEGGAGNIRVPLPRISKEVREKLSRSVKKRAESCKQRVRGVRRKAMDVVKKGKDGKLAGVSKDDAFALGKEIDAASEAASETIKTIVDDKMESILSV